MNRNLSRICIVSVLVMAALSSGQSSSNVASGQTFLATAARRSQNAAKTIKIVTEMPADATIPEELFNQAYAIGVFPDVAKVSVLFTQGMKGYGVICSRQPESWSLPAYYRYGSGKIRWKIAGAKSFDLIILFMKKDVVSWFQGGRLEFKDLKAAVPGPVGKLTPQTSRDISGVGVIMYALVDGKIQGMGAESDFWEGASLLDPDNNVNKAIYGLKAREVLLGKVPKLLPTTSEAMAFKDILVEKFPHLAAP